MQPGPGSANFVANACPRDKYPVRFMAAHAKHRRNGRRAKERPERGRVRAHRGSNSSKLPASRVPLKTKAGEPKRDVALAPRVAAPDPTPDETHAVRMRERSAYDGDTAIKLYLREIGQVKL